MASFPAAQEIRRLVGNSSTLKMTQNDAGDSIVTDAVAWFVSSIPDGAILAFLAQQGHEGQSGSLRP